MISSKHPAFAKLAPKLTRASRELDSLIRFLKQCDDSGKAADDWGRASAAALGIHNVYNGIEDVMLSLANDIDDYVPKGETFHQDLLDQMSVDIYGKRPALFDERFFLILVELKGFRHLVRHRYGFDLEPSKVMENVMRMRDAFPAFVEAVQRLERTLTTEVKDENAASDDPVADDAFKPGR